MAERFTIKIPCKKYVRTYLELNCGDPVDLSHLKGLFKEFKICLSKKPEHREKANVARYDDFVSIIIPTDMFYRFGWEMNKENLLDFNRAAEQQVKFFMRQFISINHNAGMSVAECIRNFQNKFGFTEMTWNYDSIKKDFDRNGKLYQLKTIKNLRKEVNEILLDNLAYVGTISKKFKNQCVNEQL
jgi:hypothetical protein